MKASFEQELESLRVDYAEWDKALGSHFKLTYEDDDQEDLDAHIQVSTRVHTIFRTILSLFAAHGKARDAWIFSAQPDILPFGQQCSVRSEKMDVTFDFGVYYNDFFLHSDLRYPFFIKNMDDQFWSHFVELQSLGQFEFMENAGPSSNEADTAMKHLKNTKSNIFQMIRNYILLDIYADDVTDLGSIEIKWPVTDSWDSIIENGLSAFTRLYRINYMLYRYEYLRMRNIRKRRN